MEIIVAVQRGSVLDDSLRRVPSVRLITADRTLDDHVSLANISGRAAAGEFLLFTTEDVAVMPNAVEAVLEAMRAPNIGVVAGKVASPLGKIRAAGGLVWRDSTCSSLGAGATATVAEFSYRRQVDYCSIDALVVRSSLFRELNGFDEEYAPGAYADVDLCFRARAKGYLVVYAPEARFMAQRPVPADRQLHPIAPRARGTREQARNRDRFAARWGPEVLKRRAAVPASVAHLLGSKATPRPKILVCDWLLPSPDRDSTSHRMDAILHLLVPLAERVTLIAKVRGANFRYAKRLRHAGVEVITPRPSFERFIRTRDDYYDLVILSRLQTAVSWLDAVRCYQRSAAVVFDTVDVHSLRYAREREVTGARHVDPYRTEQLERRIIAGADITAAITSEDESAIKRMDANARTIVLPNVHSIVGEPPPPFTTRSGLLFIGSFLHSPNVDAIQWFGRAILPLVRRDLVVDVTVIGADPPASLLREFAEDMTFTGWVEDVSPLFARARVFISPLRFGAGMKGKVGQALAFGLPTVTTSIGAEGMELDDGKHCLVRNEARSFADGVLHLYRDELLWNKLSAMGEQTVRERWGSEAMSRRLIELIRMSRPGSFANTIPRGPSADAQF
jgi:glycosyltransferase involved in cell wall biosynthesis